MSGPSSRKRNREVEDEGTPLMRQYLAIKERYRDAILLYRMGDFYEMFYDDARTGAEALGIALTSRNNGRAGRVPLAGIPVKASVEYINRLVKSGFKVAVCEQVEDPRTAKGIVRREVVEVITPGTIMAPGLLSTKVNNYLAAVCPSKKSWGLSYVDLSTGEFWVTEVDSGALADEIARIGPAEVVLPDDEADCYRGKVPDTAPITEFHGWAFTLESAEEELKRHLGVVTLDGYGCEGMKAGISAAGGLLAYVNDIQPHSMKQIRSLRTYDPSRSMVLDKRTIENLELIRPLRGTGTEGTLLGAIDLSVTPMGGRLLRRWILQPLFEIDGILLRQGAVAELYEASEVRRDLRSILVDFHDLERVSSRIASGRAGARDLVALRNSLRLVPRVIERTAREPLEEVWLLTGKIVSPDEVAKLIEQAIVEDPPASTGEGGLIRDGYNEELDRVRETARTGKEWIAGFQEEERRRTGISSLRVGFNKVFGYYIEVSRANLPRVPPGYIRKQTLVGAERYVTEALKEREEEILGAEEKANRLEYEIFERVRLEVAARVEEIQSLALSLARLDVVCALAEVARKWGYSRPVVNDGGKIVIREGRHPVVEQLVMAEHFVPNDTLLDIEDERVIILTGPNMAGKSTYLRQVGLIVLLAQVGSFVPAAHAEVGVVDRIFTRVGATDDLAGGRSTFLVEMTETANILNNATRRSLVLLDEIGRGTSTFDGLAIAWAVTEHLVTSPVVSARTIFATHYHELTELASRYPEVRNFNVLVKEWKDRVVFLRRIEAGRSDRSYGVEVARIAGLTASVVARAREILAYLESDRMKGHKAGGIPRPGGERSGVRQISLFEEVEHRVAEKLRSLELEGLTPLDAINVLHDLQEELK